MTDRENRLWADDFTEFTRWYEAKQLRAKGKAPSSATTVSKRRRLAAAALLAGVDTVENFGTLMQDREFCEVMLDKLAANVSSGTARGTVYALLDFGEWAKAKGLATSCALTQRDTPPSNPQRPITVYSAEEVETMVTLARAKGLRWWAFVTFLADTGRRVGEALALHWSWFRLGEEVPFIELPYTKNGRAQYVPLGRRLREDVFTPEHIEQLHVAESGNLRSAVRSVQDYPFPWQYGVAHQRFARFCRDAGVPNRGFHCLRHTKATELLAKGVPIQAVSALMGHSSVATTDRIYNHATALSYREYVE